MNEQAVQASLSWGQFTAFMLINVGVAGFVSFAMWSLCEAWANRSASDHVGEWEYSSDLGLCQRVVSDEEDDCMTLLCPEPATRIIIDVNGQAIYVCTDHFIDHEQEKHNAESVEEDTAQG